MKPIFVTSDTHFGHMKLVTEFKDRPEDFQERIWKNLKLLPSGSTLIHLGDFCIGKDEKFHLKWNHLLPKRKILVRGNHDMKSDSWYYDHGWSFVCESFILKVFGKRILFSHRPKDHSHYSSTNLNIHGHTHGNTHREEEIQYFYDSSYHIEIAQEKLDYKPLLLTEKIIQL